VKGIGRWTAQMFLLFRLGRPNVLPDLDLGIRKAIQHAYGLRRMPTPQEVLARGAPWSPYASIAAWYLWRSLELPEAASVRRRPPAKGGTTSRRRAGPKRASTRGARPKTERSKESSSRRATGRSAPRSKRHPTRRK
jgi:hypothetical protein